MKTDEELWSYMVDEGDRKKPRWSRNYTLTILASKRPDWVQQVWQHAEKQRLNKNVDEELARNCEITEEFARLLTKFPTRPCIASLSPTSDLFHSL